VPSYESREDRLSGRKTLTSPALYGCAGTELSADERRFFADVNPLGFILFARNCSSGSQISDLTASLRDAVGRSEAMILIDQEGGRVARLKAPEFRAAPPAQVFGRLAAKDLSLAQEAARLNARLIASELFSLGINVDCLPVLDVPAPGGHDIIGDRAFASDPEVVAALGRSTAKGLMAGGVLPIAKHIPGHGRAGADSHLALPVVDAPRTELEQIDFLPFRALRDLPLAMTAHVVYSAIDAVHPATTSTVMIRDIIRGQIGFDGLLMSDDVSMEALAGPIASRAQSALSAGCDVVLHCNGKMAEMVAIADAVGAHMTLDAQRRAGAALSLLQEPEAFDPSQGLSRLNAILGEQ
jgi:beta-N-acetylhexosaminidase